MARTARTEAPETKRKSEIVTVRLDPKLKYLAELAAKRQRRPLSSFIEWAVEQSLAQVYPDPMGGTGNEAPESFNDVANNLWDIDEPDRFVKLALRYPDLLDHSQQRLWKLIRENGALWRGHFDPITDEFEWKFSEETLRVDVLRQHWETFGRVASGEEKLSALPTWVKKNPNPPVPF
jgi:hypothetical protein